MKAPLNSAKCLKGAKSFVLMHKMIWTFTVQCFYHDGIQLCLLLSVSCEIRLLLSLNVAVVYQISMHSSTFLSCFVPFYVKKGCSLIYGNINNENDDNFDFKRLIYFA